MLLGTNTPALELERAPHRVQRLLHHLRFAELCDCTARGSSTAVSHLCLVHNVEGAVGAQAAELQAGCC